MAMEGDPEVMFLAAKTEFDSSRSLASISGKRPSMSADSGVLLGEVAGKTSGSRPVILETDRCLDDVGEAVLERVVGSCLYKLIADTGPCRDMGGIVEGGLGCCRCRCRRRCCCWWWCCC